MLSPSEPASPAQLLFFPSYRGGISAFCHFFIVAVLVFSCAKVTRARVWKKSCYITGMSQMYTTYRVMRLDKIATISQAQKHRLWQSAIDPGTDGFTLLEVIYICYPSIVRTAFGAFSCEDCAARC